MKAYRYLLPVLSLTVASLFIASCSKEKATAIKNTAEQARVYADAALASTRDLIVQSVALPGDSREERVRKVAVDLEAMKATEINAEAVTFLIKELEPPGDTALKQSALDGTFGQLLREQAAFAGMFSSLPEGSYFAAKTVGRAERHAIRLATEFMSFAQTLGRTPVAFTGRRTLLVEAMVKARKVSDDDSRKTLLQSCSAALIQLQIDEAKARNTAITQCLQAAEAYKTCAELIRDYDKVSLSDVLVIGRELLSTASTISGGQKDIAGLLTHYQSVEDTIRSDSYWKILLDQTVNP